MLHSLTMMKCSLSPQVVQSLMQYHEYTQSSAEFQWFVVVYKVSSVFLYCLASLPRNTCAWNESACPQQWALSLELLFNISCNNFLIQTHSLKHFIRKSLYSPHTNILAVEGLWLIISQNCSSQHFLQTPACLVQWTNMCSPCLKRTTIAWVWHTSDTKSHKFRSEMTIQLTVSACS